MIEKNDVYTEIAMRLLESPEFDEIKPFASFVVLSSDKEKTSNKRIVYGQCLLVQENYKWCCPYDFLIIIYQENIERFTDEQLEILLRHEMHHMGYDVLGNEPKPYIVPHDVEEFDEIINKFGIHWDAN